MTAVKSAIKRLRAAAASAWRDTRDRAVLVWCIVSAPRKGSTFALIVFASGEAGPCYSNEPAVVPAIERLKREQEPTR